MLKSPVFPPPPTGATGLADDVLTVPTKRDGFSDFPPTFGDVDDLVGTTLNDTYAVARCIGEGGMGRVYEARHTRIPQKRFAIKVLKTEFAHNAEVLARFQREAEATACIAHRNVIGVYDVDRTPQGRAYLVCELLEGIDLSEHIENVGKLSLPAAVGIVLQVCDALQAAHCRGVIHRDLKPQNVFLVGDLTNTAGLVPDVKVLDFGLSRFVDGTDNQLTKTGIIMGTPAYMPPEQARGERADQRSDIYGVGALLYAALSGSAPFQESTPQMTVLAVMGKEPARLRSLEPSVPETLELVVQRAMAKAPAERYGNITELRAALEPFVAGQPDAVGLGLVRPGSALALEQAAGEVRTVRPRLLGWLLVTVGLLAAIFAMVVAGLEVLLGGSFTATEFAFLILAAVGTALTPAILVALRIRRVWNNSARVLGLLERVRRPLLAGLIAYAVAALAVRFADDVAARFGGQPWLGHDLGISWRGWSLVLPLVGMLAAGATLVRSHLLRESPGWLRRFAAGPVLVIGATVSAGLLLYGGFRWRAQSAGSTVALHQRQPPKTPTTPAAVVSPMTPEPSPAQAPETPHAIGRPTDEELAAAVARGVDGLLPLAERYPTDPLVLKRLFLAFASRATGRSDAIAVAKRLLQVAPAEAADSELRIIVMKAAETPGQASDQALDLMANHMASHGPDLLYELMLTKPRLSQRAATLLRDPDVQQRFSPALAVAYELRHQNSCAGRVPLLTRAENLGDERSVQILSPLSTGSKTGCGKRKRQPCVPTCAKEAPQFRAVIVKISQRLAQR